MSDSSAPRAVEQLLGALGADTELAERIIGDLAEEYAMRHEADGRAAARRWYYREAARVTPHLLRGWWRGLRWSDAGALANDVAWASICSMAVNYFLGLAAGPVVASLLRTLGAPIDGVRPLGLALMVSLPFTLWMGGFSGYLAAKFHKRAPIPGAVALTTVWIVVAMVSVVTAPPRAAGVTLWFPLANLSVLMMGMLLGGVLRALRGTAETGVPIAADSAKHNKQYN